MTALKCRIAILLALAVTGLARADLAQAEVVVVVAAKSPITSMSAAEIADVFLGRLTKLPDGTRAAPIDAAEGSSVRNQFYDTIARMSPVQLKAYWSKQIFTGRGRPPRSVDSDQAVLRALQANPAAIGYVDRSFADDRFRILH